MMPPPRALLIVWPSVGCDVFGRGFATLTAPNIADVALRFMTMYRRPLCVSAIIFIRPACSTFLFCFRVCSIHSGWRSPQGWPAAAEGAWCRFVTKRACWPTFRRVFCFSGRGYGNARVRRFASQSHFTAFSLWGFHKGLVKLF